MFYQKSYQPGLSFLQLDKKHLQKCHHIFGRDREPNRISAGTEERLSNKSRKVIEFVYECSNVRLSKNVLRHFVRI